ncbi:MAG: glycosyltransferase family 9 protein [Candidatus Melainabacteria bacterium]|nr:glycosyltransferase family 9 protein [Candidatus Melainabacteria bacterium]
MMTPDGSRPNGAEQADRTDATQKCASQAPPSQAPQSAPRSLVVIPPRFVGDAIVTVPLLRNLREQFPSSRLAVLVSRASAPLLQANPALDEVLIDERKTLKTLSVLRDFSPQVAIVLRRSVSTAALCRLAGASTVVGYNRQRWFPPLNERCWGAFLSRSLPYPALDTRRHQVDSHLDFIPVLASLFQQPLHAPMDRHLALWVPEAVEAPMAERWRQWLGDTTAQWPNTPYAILHAVAASREKAIDASCWVQAVQQLHQRQWPILATGTQADRAFYESIAAQAKVPLINLAGETSLLEMAALLRHARVLLGLDSAPIHMAAAVGTPAIVPVFGPVNHWQWAPLAFNSQVVPVYRDGLSCRPCWAKVCEHNRCRTEITPEQIATALEQALRHAAQ